MKRLPVVLLIAVLSLALVVQGCAFSVSQFEAVLNEVGPAALTILQIVAIVKGVPVNTALPNKINADVAGAEKLYTDLQAADAVAKPGIEGQINAGFVVLNEDLSTAFSIAQVSDPNTQAKITALTNLVITAVNIAEAAIPQPVGVALKPGVAKAANLDASSLADSWNKILVAKTGNKEIDKFTPKHKIHNHGLLVRTVTVGVAK